MTLLMALTRWTHLLSLMVLFGACAFQFLLARKGHTTIALRARWLVVAALVSAVIQLFLTTANMTGWQGFSHDAITSVMHDTTFGQVFVWRGIALLALAALTVLRKPPLLLIAVLSAIALAAVGITSHAAANGREAYAGYRAANDAIHLVMGGFWLGGLFVLLRMAREKRPMFAPVGIFSEYAIYAVTFLALAGMINAGFIYAAQRVNWTYTLLLLTKISLAVAMLGLAFFNRLRVMPALAEGRDADALARNVHTELMLGAGVVAIAALLGSISPG